MQPVAAGAAIFQKGRRTNFRDVVYRLLLEIET